MPDAEPTANTPGESTRHPHTKTCPERADRRSRRGRNWGGRRRGAGAPPGNLNAFRHGRYSTQHRAIAELIAQIPEAEKAILQFSKRRRKKEKEAQDNAGMLMAEILRRIGEAFINPRPNQLELNQDLVVLINALQAAISENSQKTIK